LTRIGIESWARRPVSGTPNPSSLWQRPDDPLLDCTPRRTMREPTCALAAAT
jgi:hypothetical protein